MATKTKRDEHKDIDGEHSGEYLIIWRHHQLS